MIVVHQVNTGGTMLTLTNTIVDVLITVLPRPAYSTLAMIVAYKIRAGVGVNARIR